MYSRYFFKESNNNKPNHPFKCTSRFTPSHPPQFQTMKILWNTYHLFTTTYSHILTLNNSSQHNNYSREEKASLKNLQNNKNLITHSPFPNLITTIQKFIQDIFSCGLIDHTTYKFLLPHTPSRTPTLYLLPKIHKGDIPGRVHQLSQGVMVPLSSFQNLQIIFSNL